MIARAQAALELHDVGGGVGAGVAGVVGVAHDGGGDGVDTRDQVIGVVAQDGGDQGDGRDIQGAPPKSALSKLGTELFYYTINFIYPQLEIENLQKR